MSYSISIARCALSQSESDQPKYEMSPDEVRIVEWLERYADETRSVAPPPEPTLSNLQQLAGGILSELVAKQIRLGMHRK